MDLNLDLNLNVGIIILSLVTLSSDHCNPNFERLYLYNESF